MERSRTEWLLVPLLVLPVAAGAALCLWARFAYQADVEPYRAEGERLARAWMDGLDDGGLALRELFLGDHAAASAPGDVPFRTGRFQGLVRTGSEALGTSRWEFADTYPGGLSPTALADASVRLEIESGGRPTASLDGADDATRAFGSLIGGGDLALLRTAPLPAATKLFLVSAWRRDAPEDAALAEADALLTALREAERMLPDDASAIAVGKLENEGVRVLVLGSGRPALVLPAGADGPAEKTYQFASADSENVRLVWGEAGSRQGEVAWSGVLATPLAGRWSLVLPHGDRWWDAPTFRRWAGVGGAVLLAFLCLPAALLIALRKQRRLDEARARFINELAHDLRTPLTSLRLYADMLAGARVAEEDRGRYTDVIARESARLTGLLANLLDLGRLERGKRIFEIETLPLADTVAAAVRDFRALYPKRADDVTIEGPSAVHVRADATALARCLANLLDNAGKFTPEGTAIRVLWEERGETVVLAVQDEGMGIPEAERARIFSRYERGAGPMRDGVPGTGLGLSLVRELMEGMGGSAVLLPNETGAAFELCLPGGAGA